MLVQNTTGLALVVFVNCRPMLESGSISGNILNIFGLAIFVVLLSRSALQSLRLTDHVLLDKLALYVLSTVIKQIEDLITLAKVHVTYSGEPVFLY